jgi:hypothetical protein
VAAIAFTQWRARRARLGYSQVVEPLPVFVMKIALAALVVMFIIVRLARFKNLPWVLVLLAALVVGYSLLTNRAVSGCHIYAVGGNLQAATLSGRRASARGPRRGRARRGTRLPAHGTAAAGALRLAHRAAARPRRGPVSAYSGRSPIASTRSG